MRKKINIIYEIEIRLGTEYRTNPSKGQEIVQGENMKSILCSVQLSVFH